MARGIMRQAIFRDDFEGIANQWVKWLGRSGRRLAEQLGVRPESVYRAARRGSRDAERLQQLLE